MNDNISDEKEEYLFDSLNTDNISNKEIENLDDNSFINEENNLYDNKNDKKNNIKNIIIGLIATIIVLLITFLLNKGKIITKDALETKMIEFSKNYYEKYMSINDNTNEYIVTLDMLENANKQGEKYDLKGLEKCKKQTTQSKIIIDFKSKKLKKIEVELNC